MAINPVAAKAYLKTPANGYSIETEYKVIKPDDFFFEKTSCGPDVVQVPSSNINGVPIGFDCNKPIAVLVDSYCDPFVIGDLTKVDPAIIERTSKDMYEQLVISKLTNTGQIMHKILKKNLAHTDEYGDPVVGLQTWVSDGRDAFRNPVVLNGPKLETKGSNTGMFPWLSRGLKKLKSFFRKG